jgi:myo-inositol-1(or 4)-monophosphatase
VRGHGATRDGERIATSGKTEEAGIMVGVNGVLSERQPWAQVRTMGAAALEMCLVADGALDGYVQAGGASLHPWDYLGAMLIVEEAGGYVAAEDDEPLIVVVDEPRRPVVAATKELALLLSERCPL